MKLETLTTSVNYWDFLQECLIYNQPLLDKWLIITTPNDTQTITLCEEFQQEYITTNEFYYNNWPFCRSRALEVALQTLDKDGWILFLDSDILLPKNFRQRLEETELEKDALYSVKRIDCKNYKQLMDRIKNPTNESNAYDTNSPGYLHLFHHSRMPTINHFPSTKDTDLDIARQFTKHIYIPNTCVYHLHTGSVGTDWAGRFSEKWGKENAIGML